jgi:anti-sigma factor RsiW
VSASFDRHIPEEHIPEDILDEFVMEMLSEQDSAFWEEHLLICARCQDRVARADEYVRAMKSAAASISDPPSEQNRRSLAKPMLVAATHA